MGNQLPTWVRRWWDIANERRGTLINKKYLRKSPGLTKAQEQELELLQRVAGDVLDVYTSPLRPTLTREDIEAALSKSAAGVKDLKRQLDAVFGPRPSEGKLQ